MNGFPSTLHRSMKYTYHNNVYTIKFDPESYHNYLQIETGMTNTLTTLTPITQVELKQEEE